MMGSPQRSPGLGQTGDLILSQPTWITDCDITVAIPGSDTLTSPNGSVFTGYILQVSILASHFGMFTALL